MIRPSLPPGEPGASGYSAGAAMNMLCMVFAQRIPQKRETSMLAAASAAAMKIDLYTPLWVLATCLMLSSPRCNEFMGGAHRNGGAGEVLHVPRDDDAALRFHG